MKCYHSMVDQIPQKRILRPWNQWESHCLHRRPHIWNSHTSGASHDHNTRELALKQKLNFHQLGVTIKRHHMCRSRHFVEKDSCAKEIQLLNTPHDRRRYRQAMTQHWFSSINTICSPQKKTKKKRKKKLACALSRPGVGATVVLTAKITWWHGNADWDCSPLKL